MSSIYTDCSQAVRRLLEDPSLADSGIEGVFTELDVINLASKSRWGQKGFRRAMREANEVVTGLYRTSRIARYGPVKVPEREGTDYVRIAAKVVYAHPENGPEEIETANGTFKRMMVGDETDRHAGRRVANNRDDLTPWDEQDISTVQTVRTPTRQSAQVTQLQADLKAAHDKIRDQQTELSRLRAHKAAQTKGIRLSDEEAAVLSSLITELVAQAVQEQTDPTAA